MQKIFFFFAQIVVGFKQNICGFDLLRSFVCCIFSTHAFIVSFNEIRNDPFLAVLSFFVLSLIFFLFQLLYKQQRWMIFSQGNILHLLKTCYSIRVDKNISSLFLIKLAADEHGRLCPSCSFQPNFLIPFFISQHIMKHREPKSSLLKKPWSGLL